MLVERHAQHGHRNRFIKGGAMVQIVLLLRVASVNDAIVWCHQFGQLLNSLVHECRWHHHWILFSANLLP